MQGKGCLVLFIGLGVLVGPTPLIVGAVLTWMEWSEYQARAEVDRERAHWIEAEARVVSCGAVNREHRTGDLILRSEIEWTDREGHTHRSSHLTKYCEDYTVFYNPENPDQIFTPVGLFLPAPFILCVIGIGFTSIGVKEWLKWRREARSSRSTSKSVSP